MPHRPNSRILKPMDPAAWPLPLILTVFLAAALITAGAGVYLARLASRISRITGLGQAVTGALFLGAATSLSGIITSVTAAASGHPELAAGNAVGGIAAQTVFLAVADQFYRKANLEHAAASDENILQAALLVTLLALVLLAFPHTPAWAPLGIHPLSLIILGAYAAGQKLVYEAKGADMWRPRITDQTEGELPPKEKERTQQAAGKTLPALLLPFLGTALLIGTAGAILAQTGTVLSARTGLNETLVGGLLTAVSTSFPELVTAVAAVRMGALTLAVSDIVGGNAFDVIFLAVADTAYREGSLYHAMGPRPAFLIILTLLLTGILLLGLVRREKHGIANIGFESFLLLIVYGAGFAFIALSGA